MPIYNHLTQEHFNQTTNRALVAAIAELMFIENSISTYFRAEIEPLKTAIQLHLKPKIIFMSDQDLANLLGRAPYAAYGSTCPLIDTIILSNSMMELPRCNFISLLFHEIIHSFNPYLIDGQEPADESYRVEFLARAYSKKIFPREFDPSFLNDYSYNINDAPHKLFGKDPASLNYEEAELINEFESFFLEDACLTQFPERKDFINTLLAKGLTENPFPDTHEILWPSPPST